MSSQPQHTPKSAYHFLFTLLLTLVPAFSTAEPVHILVRDEAGTPLEDAVIAVTTPSAQLKAQTVAVVDQVDKRFKPRVSIIHQGQSVSFPNSDNIRHHVYSFSNAKKFELKLYKGEASRLIKFETPGIVSLGCNIHDRMRGYIYVNGAGETAYSTSADGKAELPHIDFDTLYVWHEHLIDPKQRKRVSQTEWKKEDGAIVITLATRTASSATNRGFTRRF